MSDHITQFFRYEHLPPASQGISKPLCELARRIEEQLPRNAERTVALRKLLEAKDAAVRAYHAKHKPLDIGPTIGELLEPFEYEHLPIELQEVSKPYCEIAYWLSGVLPPNRQRVNALDKLVESKDAAVRAQLAREVQSITPADVGDVSTVLGVGGDKS